MSVSIVKQGVQTCSNVHQPLQRFGCAAVVDPGRQKVVLVIVLGADAGQGLELTSVQPSIDLPNALWTVANRRLGR